jgi:1-acyl-sn-glycerol-3-phosphate acyltransferase
MALLVDPAIAERVRRLELTWGSAGTDHFGVSAAHLDRFFTILSYLYRHYFTVTVTGTENVPPRGRAMLVGNHSGGVALDGLMVIAAMFFELEPPRLAHGMAEKFLNQLPLASAWSSRLGQLTGLPENATRLLEAERLLMVFPEGARGTAKLYGDRNGLVDFGTGFVRLALETRTPIIPFAFVGGGDAIPTVTNLYRIGRLLGMPYLPITPWLLPLPRPVPLEIYLGRPIHLDGTGGESDETVLGWVDDVKAEVATLVDDGVKIRRGRGEAVR